MSGPADERQPLRVLVGPRAFAYEHQSRVPVTGPKNYFVTAFMEAAAFAVADILNDFFERVVFRGEREDHRRRVLHDSFGRRHGGRGRPTVELFYSQVLIEL